MSSQGKQNEGDRIGGVRLSAVNVIIIVMACFVSLMFLQAVRQTNNTYRQFEKATDNYIVCEDAAAEMKAGSNYLTIQIRSFVISHDLKYLDNYFTEAFETKRRDNAVDVLERYLTDSTAHEYLKESQKWSNELMGLEYYAAKLVLEATGQAPHLGADVMGRVELNADDEKLADDDKLKLASDMVFGDTYYEYVEKIEGNVVLCKNSLLNGLNSDKEANAARIDSLLASQQVLTWLLLGVTIAMILLTIVLVLWPTREFIARMGKNSPLPLAGSNEMRVMANHYNDLYEANLKHNADLRRKAEHDHLTGLYNREVFERILHAYRNDNCALLLVDLDYFKEVNDTIGHEGGDRALRKLAGLLSDAFRVSDYVCRIGGDEFAVIMTDMTSDLYGVIVQKVKQVSEGMALPTEDLPALTLSVGAAFSGEGIDSDQLFRNADEALYKVKQAGRNGLDFYQE